MIHLKHKEAVKTMITLGDYNALNFVNKPLEPFTNLLHRNFIIEPINQLEFDEYCKTNKDWSVADLYRNFTGDYTVVVSFTDQLDNPSITRQINHEYFVRVNNWEHLLN